MRHIRYTAIGALSIAAAVALAGCSSAGNTAGSDSGPQSVPTTKASDKTLTVWVMEGDYTDATVSAIKDEFTKQTGAKVNVQKQVWDGITTKVSTALATSTPPDVFDLGNTQVAGYAAAGGLLDITSYKDDLAQGQTWLTGLSDPATVDGKLYAVPGFAGTRAVIYNKKIWSAAGVTKAPTTFAEFTADLDKIKAKNTASDFSPFYQPGQYWYGGMQFVWDAGGDIATSKNGTWTAGFGTPEAQKGLTAFKEFQNKYSTVASRTLDNVSPDFNQIFADGKTSAILNVNGAVGLIEKINPSLQDSDFGSFPFPGLSGKSQPVMLGGSDWGIAAKSKKTDLALAWAKIAASPTIQNKYVYGGDHWIPNSTEGIKAADSSLSDLNKGFFEAALNSKATPASGAWATIEGNKTINDLFSEVTSGRTTVAEAADRFDSVADKQLNAK